MRNILVVLSSIAVAILWVVTCDLLTGTMEPEWDALVYVDMAKHGMLSNENLVAPFAYRPAVPTFAGLLARFLSVSVLTSFRIAGYLFAILELCLAFALARAAGARVRDGFIVMAVVAISYSHLRFPLFFYTMVDIGAYPMMLLAFWALFKQRYLIALGLCCIGLLFKEFLIVPSLILIVMLARTSRRKPSRKALTHLLLAIALIGCFVIIPRLIIPIESSVQFFDPVNKQDSLYLLLKAPADLRRSINIAFSLASYWLPSLMLITWHRLKAIRTEIAPHRLLMGLHVVLVSLLALYGGTNIPVFVSYTLPVQIVLLSLLLRQRVHILELAWMLLAVLLYNRIFSPLPDPGANFQTYVDFYAGYDNQINMATLTRTLEMVSWLGSAILLRTILYTQTRTRVIHQVMALQHWLAKRWSWKGVIGYSFLLIVLFLLAHVAYALPRSATLQAKNPALEHRKFHGAEQFADREGFFRWTKGNGRVILPNPGGKPLLHIVLAGGPARSVDVRVRQGEPQNWETTFTVRPEPRVYRLMLPPNPSENIRLSIKSPTIEDPDHGYDLGVVVGDIVIQGSGQSPRHIWLLALLVASLLFINLRQLRVPIALAIASTTLFVGGMLFLQSMWVWSTRTFVDTTTFFSLALSIFWLVTVLWQHREFISSSENRLSHTMLLGWFQPLTVLNQPQYKVQLRIIQGVIVFLPVIATLFLVFAAFHTSLFTFVPAWSDENFYWHQTATFIKTGLAGGYYTMNEQPASLEFLRFYVHGPMFPAIYGAVTSFLGWYYVSGVLVNMVFITAALIFFLWITRADAVKTIILGMLFVTFWPLLFFLPSNMQESLHQALSIVMAGMFYRLFSIQAPPTRLLTWSLFLVITLASLLRFTWIILYVPFFLLVLEKRTPLRIVLAIGQALLTGFIIFVIFRLWSAPYPNFVSELSRYIAVEQYSVAFQAFVRHVSSNLRSLQEGFAGEILLRYQSIFLTIVTGFAFALVIERSVQCDKSVSWKTWLAPFFHLLNVGALLVLTILFYDVGTLVDYRVLAPHLLLSVLLLTRNRMFAVVFIILTNLLGSYFFLNMYEEKHAEHFQDYQSLRETRAQFQNLISYKAEQNPWCNSLFWGDYELEDNAYLTTVPAGIGISFSLDDQTLEMPLKSHYVVLKPGNEHLKDQIHVQYIGSLPDYEVYLNLDGACYSSRVSNESQ
jgi:hypothetical protein